MAIQDLVAVVPPPAHPVEIGCPGAWEAIQSELGVRLPDDWRDFGIHYGSGTITDEGRHSIWVFNPFAPAFRDKVWTLLHNLEAMRIGEGERYAPYPVFPAAGGLLAFGDDLNGNELYWLTAGDPDQWRIVVRSEDSEYEEFAGPLTSFLAGALRREIAVSRWPEPFFTDPARLRFDPD